MPREIFASQADAESWLGENWRELLEAGVEQVTLLDDDRVEYGDVPAPGVSRAKTRTP